MEKKKIFQSIFIIGIGVVLAYLFRGLYEYGLEYDEVYRINNWFPIFNKDAYPYHQSICSIYIGSVEIPIMLKAYISYAHIIPYMAVAWFDNPLIVLRTLYYIFAFVNIIVLYLVLSKYNHRIAVITAVLLTLNPLLYPEIRFGWANLLYGIALALAFEFWNRYWDSMKLRYLWLSVFCLCLQVNIQFYFIWVAASLVVTMMIVYPKRMLKLISSLKNLLIIISAAALGLINFIIYNIKTGFPTFMTLWNYLFHRDVYNQNAVDNVKTESFAKSLQSKLQSYLNCVGIGEELFIFFIFALVVIDIIFLVQFIRKKQLEKKKVYFIPGLVTIFAFLMMLISPNSQNAHHLTYMVITFTVWIACSFELILENGLGKCVKYITYGFIGVISFVFLIQSNVSVIEANETKGAWYLGTRYFSDNIYDLIEYVDEHDEITGENMLFVEWGFASQFYFMHSGEFKIKEILWLNENQTVQSVIADYVRDVDSDCIYIPGQYSEIADSDSSDFVLQMNDHGAEKNILLDEGAYERVHELQVNGGVCSIEKIFDQNDGSDGIVLLRVDNIETVKQNIQ